MKELPSAPGRIYRLKLVIAGLLLLALGLALSLMLTWLKSIGVPPQAIALLSSLSDVFLVTGAIGIAVDLFTGRDKDAADTERLRSVLKDAAPDIRNAVIDGFAKTPDAMSAVATPETLDKVATNALGLRLDDQKFAEEIYSGLLDQAIRTSARWYDVDINVRLSSVEESTSHRGALALASSRSPDRAAETPEATRTSGEARSALLFDAVVVWEYTLVPSTQIQKFASTDDPVEHRELLNDLPATSTWYIPDAAADPRDRSTFEVLSYSVDGRELPVRRTTRRHGQTYSVDLGEKTILEKKPVRIRHVYRTVVPRVGHRFRVSLTQPTHGMRLVLDYSETDIARLKAGDMVSSAAPPQVTFLPENAPAKQVEVTVPGWVLPQAEVTFVWTLEDELPPRAQGAAPGSASGDRRE